MSAADLAAALSISDTTVNYWETSEQELPDEILRKIVGALDVSFSYLRGDSNDPEHKPIPAVEAAAPREFVERRRERLWLRDTDVSPVRAARPMFSCLRRCRDLYDSLGREGHLATRRELNSLALDLERVGTLVEKLLEDKESSD